jgi:hypothetical protein
VCRPESATRPVFPPHERDELLDDLTAEITYKHYLVPHRPDRRYERATLRPNSRYKTRQPGESTTLTPLTKIKLWLLPVPV